MTDEQVIVGVSPSLAGLAALRWALGEARRRQVPLLAVRAWQLDFGPRARPTWEFERATAEDARTLAHGAFRLAGESADDVVIRVPRGLAATALRDYAHPHDLLVLGAGRSRWLGGPVVRAAVRGAPCPVIVVPPPELTLHGRRAGRRLHREVSDALSRLPRPGEPEKRPGWAENGPAWHEK
ncbi:nucleotide-binding universal stress UspA family protein [Actinoplanes tereljensis]|uniref:UspA domain-containing protein n=1 Tax=Paractinoplanes tereljensis TaxID=571912 RepID=A0A919NUI1_9ACTN|nr:universal stress protein [Actinoplanes tereljensis]GIF25501.1 hypothetical protein Ate02nite_82310 [Actinoplanes tereljensis]